MRAGADYFLDKSDDFLKVREIIAADAARTSDAGRTSTRESRHDRTNNQHC
jgi:hypothetical protein